MTWEDDHVSSFSDDWLREYGFTADKQQERETNLSLPLVLWNNATMQDKVPKFKFDDVSFCVFLRNCTIINQSFSGFTEMLFIFCKVLALLLQRSRFTGSIQIELFPSCLDFMVSF